MFNRAQFIEDLKYLAAIEVPWRHQGSNPNVGMDCIGSLRWAYERQGLKLPDELDREFAAYHRPPNGWHMNEVMKRWFIEIELGEAEPSDLYQIFIRKNPCHIAVKVSDDPLTVAEAYQSMDGAISKFMVRPMPKYHILTCFRIPDFAAA
jgi:hypothetical protein